MRAPFRGLVGQRMDGRKDFAGARHEVMRVHELAAGSGTLPAPVTGWAHVYLIGGGGTGNCGGGGGGGGGGGACYGAFRVQLGDIIAYTIGAGAPAPDAFAPGTKGEDSVAVSPSGHALRAGGGNGGAPGANGAGGKGGIATGGMRNFSGGDGGSSVGGVATAGAPGENGGGAGATPYNAPYGGGGGAASPAPLGGTLAGLIPGAGSNGAVPAGNWGGGLGSLPGSTMPGADGRGLIVFTRSR